MAVHERAFRGHARLSLFAVVAGVCDLSVGILALFAGCGGTSERNPIVIPLHIGEGMEDSYIQELASGVNDPTSIAFAWIESSPRNSRLWNCIVEYEARSGAFHVNAEPVLVDQQGGLVTHGGIEDVTVLSHNGSYGILYAKDHELLLRWPTSSVPRVLTTKHEETPTSSAALVLPNGDVVIAALLFMPHAEPRFTYHLVCFRIGTASGKVKLASVTIEPSGTTRPKPVLRLTGNILTLGVLLPWGRVTDIAGNDLHSTPDDNGQFVTLQLSEDLKIQRYHIDGLPDDSDIKFANCIAPVDAGMRTLVAGKPRLKVMTLDRPQATMQRLSSPAGLGSLFAVPSAQSLSQSDTSAVVAWIDTDRSFAGLVMTEGAKDPTGNGGDIQARLVSQNGRVDPSPIEGFPIRTQAQCLQLGKIANRPFIAWAGPGRTGLRITVLPAEKKH